MQRADKYADAYEFLLGVGMLREFTKNDWQQILGIPAERIPRALILRGTRNLAKQYEAYRSHFSNVLEVGSPNGLIEHLLIGELGGNQVAYASIYGSAMASEVAHLFGVLGTELVVQTGCCGAWGEKVRPGDLFVATSAYCGEGAAQYYVGTKEVVAPTLDSFHNSQIHQSKDIRLFRGGIYTTAALFGEGRAEIESWAKSGWSAVDMETATTFAVAEHFGMDSTSILFVFDNPRDHGDIVLNDDERDGRREMGNQAMVDCAFRIVEHYLGGDP